VQVANASASSLHWNVEPASVEVKLKLAVVWFVGFAGPAVIVVFGAVRSTVQVCCAGEPSTFPAGSVARTLKVWLPPASPVYVWGDAHAAKAEPSRLHWNVEPASVDVKVKDAVVWFVGLVGALVTDVSGAVTSIVHVCEAGVASVFPAGSVART
jgi:hypothetical protein